MTKMNAEQMLTAIEEMSNKERNKLLEDMAGKYFGYNLTTEDVKQLNYEAFHGDDED
ncbi:hypothetical protein [Peribacillus loiseleuriae]|uniref:hypothetical protein n=1 Tax=Peribacillus loiseleuriae TaxID=1679170 RepID=UPI003D02A69A